MNTNLIFTTGLAVLAISWHLACGSDDPTLYGAADNLGCVNLPDSGSSGGGSGPGQDASGGSGGQDAGGGEAGGDGGCAVADGGCPSWKNDIFTLMTGSWHCADSNCHGGTYSPTIDPSSESATYQNLANYQPPACNLPFIHEGSTDPTATSFVSVLQGSSCGAQMPYAPGALGANDMCVVESWIACGMHEN